MIKRALDGTHETPHAPGAKLDYGVDWAPSTGKRWLAPGETIVTSEWAAPAGITLSDATVTGGTVASVWAEGGVAGQSYVLTNKIVTSEGRKDSRTLRLKCDVR